MLNYFFTLQVLIKRGLFPLQVRYRKWKGKLKESDPAHHQQHMAKRKEACRTYRNTRSEEGQARERELHRHRQKAYRERKKAAANECPAQPSKPTTRLTEKQQADRREKNKLAQRKRRASMSSQKTRREREKNQQYYWRKKVENEAKIAAAPDNSGPLNLLLHNFLTPQARRTTASRWMAKLPSGNYVGTLAAMVRSATRGNRSNMKAMGVSYTSTTKRQLSDDTTEPGGQPQSSIGPKWRDAFTLRAKRVLQDAKQKVFGRAGSAARLYQRRYMRPVNRKVELFFEKNSKHVPGSRSVATKKVLDRSMKDLYAALREEYPGDKISYSGFCGKKPKNVLSFTKTPFLQCRCEVCDNPLAKMKALNTFLADDKRVDLDGGVDKLVPITLCQTPQPACVDRQCPACGTKLLRMHVCEAAADNIRSTVTWVQAEKVASEGKASRLDKVPKEAPLADALELLCQELETLPRHRLNARWQQEQYRQLTTTLPHGTAVLTLDFAENYRCKHQDEPQSAYFGYQQVVLHPDIMHYRCPECADIVVDSAVFLSDDLGHTPHLVDIITQECVEYVRTKTTITNVKIFSDGCSSQYKSKVPFQYLQQLPDKLGVEVERAYFGFGFTVCW